MQKESLWDEVSALLPHAEKPSRYIASEWGDTLEDASVDTSFSYCMIYPDTYELGQANQALRILTNAVNETDGMYAERAFVPAADMIDLMRANGVPLFSLESCSAVRDFDVVGITLPHELCATNVLETLDLANIAIKAEDRSEDDPFVVAGGPVAYNPEPFAPFFDAIMIGEGEQSLIEVLEVIRDLRAQDKSRKDILVALSQIPGTYVPSLYDVLPYEQAQKSDSYLRVKDEISNSYPDVEIPTVITKRIFEDFALQDGFKPMIVPYMDVIHDRLNVEILRGCARGCRFCQAGMIYRPIREKKATAIIDEVSCGLKDTGYDELSLTSLSSTDHSQIAEILSALNREYEASGIRISLPSQRLDSFGSEMASLVAGRKKGGLTFAPEAGTQRLRDVINKNVSEDDIFSALDFAVENGWRRIKLYFMIGLPNETDDDVIGIADLSDRIYERMKELVEPHERGSISVNISVALFVPKSHTPFQWDGQIDSDEALRRISLIKRNLRNRAVRVNYHEPKTSLLEAVMSRGGREVSDLVERAWQNGARFDAWTEHFCEDAWNKAKDDTGIDFSRLSSKQFSLDETLPWDHISCGVSKDFLVKERKAADQGLTTPDCTMNYCSNCGVCQTLDCHNDLQQKRVKQ